MSKHKSISSRFLEEHNSLFETSDMTEEKPKRKQKKMQQALSAEHRSGKKVIAKNAPCSSLVNEEENEPAIIAWDNWLEA